MFPDEVSKVIVATAPVNVVDETEHYIAAQSLIDMNKQFRFPRARLELSVTATNNPTSLVFWVQFRTASGTWFDCTQSGMKSIQYDDVFVNARFSALCTPPTISIVCAVEGDDMRVGYKGVGCSAAPAGDYFTIGELNVVKLAS